MEINLFYDNLIIVPAIAFGITVFFKWIYLKIKTWKIDIAWSLWSWGMPSVHSSVVVALTTAIALKYWISSDFFAIALTFTVIIIYDAINIRFEAGQHAAAINNSLWYKKFKESLWHLPSEAFAWSVLWIVIALVLFYF